MRYINLIIIITIFHGPAAVAKGPAPSSCSKWAKLAEQIEPRSFFEQARKKSVEAREAAKNGIKIPGEVIYEQLDTFDQARNLAFNFPPGESLGISFRDYSRLDRFQVTMDSSSLKGKYVGWKQKLPDGSVGVVRLDWEPGRGAHFNLEYEKIPNKANPSVRENFKAAIHFKCQGRPCTEAEILALARQFQP
ncbi:MAG TPA: hypothetical protein DCS07_01415 [Bdellovibrionales bacterium]|nr:MAG: hypothetical protein A2Z97_14680 [Bdellovibrionales bacterium GWB1_52_6]OFZ02591.1 MAG: hypothetical protein A2X97_08015 [Bdellovibrionales bacterium GWA1_52_35]OFZ40512.1 MAG: hypothetical protein A2070_09120 [Bdellovibrionales bacterium GWC1_52_8]HAR41283.1 hypothetical protein [Bdellovibrionales bacterium]HCM41444.1 hypothetical protein [Bdellovibrionales bacterium]